MIWDRVAPLYDFVVNVANRLVYRASGCAVARLLRASDRVFECACGTGAIAAASNAADTYGIEALSPWADRSGTRRRRPGSICSQSAAIMPEAEDSIG